MDPKSLLESRTFWANLLGPIFIWLAVRYGISLDADMQSMVIIMVMSLVNIGLRKITHKPINTILPQRIFS